MFSLPISDFARFFVRLFLPLSLLVLGSMSYLRYNDKANDLLALGNEQSLTVGLAASNLMRNFELVHRDLRFLASHPFVKALVVKQPPGLAPRAARQWDEMQKEQIGAFLESASVYEEVSLLDSSGSIVLHMGVGSSGGVLFSAVSSPDLLPKEVREGVRKSVPGFWWLRHSQAGQKGRVYFMAPVMNRDKEHLGWVVASSPENIIIGGFSAALRDTQGHMVLMSSTGKFFFASSEVMNQAKRSSLAKLRLVSTQGQLVDDTGMWTWRPLASSQWQRLTDSREAHESWVVLSWLSPDSIEHPAGQSTRRYSLLGLFLLLTFALLSWHISAILVRQESARKDMEKLASVDHLTGLFNRRVFMDRLGIFFDNFRRGSFDGGIMVMMDLDYFKNINDTHGHDAGDAALRHFADLFRSSLRQCDLGARWGGEEFVAFLAGCDEKGVEQYKERLFEMLRTCPVILGGKPVHLSVSMGAGALLSTDMDTETLIRRADAALYKAKASGRARLVFCHG